MTGPQPERAVLTLAEAAAWLDPPVTQDQLAEIVHALRIRPAGKRPSGRGRPARAYDAGELMLLHTAIRPWLLRPGWTPETFPHLIGPVTPARNLVSARRTARLR
jgi:hypothetical protein